MCYKNIFCPANRSELPWFFLHVEAQEGKPGNLALGIAYVSLHILWGLEDKLDDLEGVFCRSIFCGS